MRVLLTMMKLRVKQIQVAAVAGLLVLVAGLTVSNLPTVSAAAGSTVTQAATPASAPAVDPGAAVYTRNCAICHGEEREGILPGFPPLVGIHRQMTDDKIIDLIHTGKGRMPAFKKIPQADLTALVHFLTVSQSPVLTAGGGNDLVQAGKGLFQQNCAFCHGRDTMGGESGPDLTQSKIVLADVSGDKIGEVVRVGRLEKKMPAFNFSPQEIASVSAFIHSQVIWAETHKGGRRGVTVADLQTGNVDKGKKYFNGAGGCSKCHSPTGDLAGVATRFQGLKLEERMLYPEGAKSTVVVTLPSGETVKGTLAYQDEFVIGLRDSTGLYRSWMLDRVKATVDSPVEAHVEQFPKYTDDDIHNLMAFLQTLR